MEAELSSLVRDARAAARTMAALGAAERDAALLAVRTSLNDARDVIEACNREDKLDAKRCNLPDTLLKRLDVEGAKFDAMLSKVDEVRAQTDPVGEVGAATELDTGLRLYRVACPIGVICVIFESRPEAAVQIAALTLRTANAVILKGGKEAAATNGALVAAMQGGLGASGVIPPSAVQLVSSRDQISQLLKMHGQIDLIVPRGSNALVSHIMQSTSIPVLGHADGICALYIDESAAPAVATRVAVDSKTDYPVACNAAETLLLHRATLGGSGVTGGKGGKGGKGGAGLWPQLGAALLAAGVELRADDESFAALAAHQPGAVAEAKLLRAQPSDFATEFGAKILAVKVVENVGDAAAHINAHGSHHTDCIVATDDAAVEYFMRHVDSAGVYANASTRFADGARYGFGAEVGVSTNRIHSRGPVGVQGLLIYKYKLYGGGHIAAEYSSGARSFKHAPLPLTDHPKRGGGGGGGGSARWMALLGLAAAATAAGAVVLRQRGGAVRLW